MSGFSGSASSFKDRVDHFEHLSKPKYASPTRKAPSASASTVMANSPSHSHSPSRAHSHSQQLQQADDEPPITIESNASKMQRLFRRLSTSKKAAVAGAAAAAKPSMSPNRKRRISAHVASAVDKVIPVLDFRDPLKEAMAPKSTPEASWWNEVSPSRSPERAKEQQQEQQQQLQTSPSPHPDGRFGARAIATAGSPSKSPSVRDQIQQKTRQRLLEDDEDTEVVIPPPWAANAPKREDDGDASSASSSWKQQDSSEVDPVPLDELWEMVLRSTVFPDNDITMRRQVALWECAERKMRTGSFIDSPFAVDPAQS